MLQYPRVLPERTSPELYKSPNRSAGRHENCRRCYLQSWLEKLIHHRARYYQLLQAWSWCFVSGFTQSTAPAILAVRDHRWSSAQNVQRFPNSVTASSSPALPNHGWSSQKFAAVLPSNNVSRHFFDSFGLCSLRDISPLNAFSTEYQLCR